MNQLFAGATFIVLGIILLIIFNKAQKNQRESTALQAPYLKNGGIGFRLTISLFQSTPIYIRYFTCEVRDSELLFYLIFIKIWLT
jgi:hypothetical protein